MTTVTRTRRAHNWWELGAYSNFGRVIGLCLSALILVACDALVPPRREVYLIPQDYEGPVVVVYDQAEGELVQLEEGARLFIIPNTGVLFLQDPPLYDKYLPEFWYVAEDGTRTEIPFGFGCVEDMPADELVACGMGTLFVHNGKSLPPHGSYIVGHFRDLKKHGEELFELESSLPPQSDSQ